MIYYVEAPEYGKNLCFVKSIFLAGGVTGCPDWQSELIKKIQHKDLVVYNPRRKTFDIKDKSASNVQIKWERDHLSKSDVIVFWFCKETIQPITLFELGKYAFSWEHEIIVGVELGYPREVDVVTQLTLEMPEIIIYRTLDELAAVICKIEND